MSSGPGEGLERFCDIPTRWSVLKGPRREVLDYAYRVYGNAILAYIRGRLARGEYWPLKPQDTEDNLQDFFLRLGKTEWLDKPDPARGRFRPYFIGRLDFFLRERRAAGRVKQEPAAPPATEAEAPDTLGEQLERAWRVETVNETLRRIGTRNSDWQAVLRADLEREPHETDARLAARLGRSPESFRSLLKRARAAFRDLHPLVNERLDGFGGESF